MKQPLLIALAGCLAAWIAIAPPRLVAADRHFSAQLSGSEEVPPVVTDATGHVNFLEAKDGTELHYRLVVDNLQNIVSAQIQLGARGEVGLAVATIYGPMAPGGGRKNGLIAEGTFTSSDLTGPLAGHPLSDLIGTMSVGRAYVNIHTDDGVPGASGQRGDNPDGEIRGQIH